MPDTRTPCSFAISSSIVLYRNDPTDVRAAIRSFLSHPIDSTITVVDNSPDDGLRHVVEGEGAEYVYNSKNIGFGAAHNVALRRYQDRSKYHLILNPDVTFESSTIPALYGFMQQNPTVGLVMPRILYPDGREQNLCKLLPTPMDLILRRFAGETGRKFARQKMSRYLLENVDRTRPRFVPNLSGCFMFVRMEALQTVGFFDERYFLYLEDVDLCRRVAEQFETVFYPDANIVHEYANGSYRNVEHLKLHMISAWKYFNKWGWVRDPVRRALNARAFE